MSSSVKEVLEAMARGGIEYDYSDVPHLAKDADMELWSNIMRAALRAAEAKGWVLVPRDDAAREFADSALPRPMIDAGMDILEKADDDLSNYVSGETIDWDYGMEAVAVYRAMLSAAPSVLEEK